MAQVAQEPISYIGIEVHEKLVYFTLLPRFCF